MKIQKQSRDARGDDDSFFRGEGRKERAGVGVGRRRHAVPEGRGGRTRLAVSALAATVLLGVIPASAEITATRIAKDETISVGGTTVRHVAGSVSGKAERNEPGVPNLDKVAGVRYESDFELWLPVAGGNGRFWFSVLNRGNDTGGSLRGGILRRGGAYGWGAKGGRVFMTSLSTLTLEVYYRYLSLYKVSHDPLFEEKQRNGDPGPGFKDDGPLGPGSRGPDRDDSEPIVRHPKSPPTQRGIWSID